MEMLTPKCKYPFLVFDNVIPEDKMKDVFEEISYLSKFSVDPSLSGSAIDEHGNFKKQNACVWLNDFYNPNFNLHYSSILSSLDKINRKEFEETIRSYHPAFWHFLPKNNCSTITTLLSFYCDGDFYLPHTDESIYTCVLWLNKEPKEYDGGNFIFHFEDGSKEEIETKNNRMVLFPSFYEHEVKPVHYLKEDASPRCSISLFFTSPV